MWDIEKRRAWAVLAVVIALQCAVMTYWVGQKQNLFVDEYYSFGHAHAATLPNPDFYDFPYNETWVPGTWVDARDLKAFLVVGPNDSVLKDPDSLLFAATKVRNYYVLLNIVEALLCPGEVGMGVALGLNVVLFAVSQVALYVVARGLGTSRWASLLAVLMFGFSSMAISHVTYVRFYVWVSLCMLVVVLLHERMWEGRSLPRFLLMEVVSFVLLYASARNSEFVMVVGGVLVVGFGVVLIAGRRLREAACYLVPSLGGGLWYVFNKTSVLDLFMHPEHYLGEGWPRGTMAYCLANFSVDDTIYRMLWSIRRVVDQLLGHIFIAYALVALAVVMAVMALVGRAKAPAHMAPKGSEKVGQAETDGADSAPTWPLAIVLVCAAVANFGFVALTGITINRYIMLSFPLVAAVMWLALDRLAEKAGHVRALAAVLAVVTVAGAVVPSAIGGFEYLYPKDSVLRQTLQDYQDTDVVMVYDEQAYAGTEVYDCIGLCGEDVRVYPMEYGNPHIDASTCPDELLLWVKRDADPSVAAADLVEAGYTLELVGNDHASTVYVARRASS